MTTFNHKSIQELANMATLRNHLFTLSQNQNLTSGEDSRKLRKLIGKLDREIIRRALGNLEMEKAKKPSTPKPKPRASAKKTAKKTSSKKGTPVKRKS